MKTEKHKTREQLIRELTDMHRRIEELESSDAEQRAAADLYRSIAEKSFAMLYVVQDGRFQFVNANAASFAGYAPADLVGRKAEMLVHQEDRNKVRRQARAMLTGKSASPYEYRVITADGSVRWIMETVTSLAFAGKPAVLGNALDITEYRFAEEALRESEQRLMEIIDFLPDATLVIDREGKVIAWNRAIEEMTGFRADEMLGKGDHEYSIPFYGERRPILVDLVNLPSEVLEEKYAFLRREKGVLMGDARCPMVRKEKRFLSGWATPIYNLKGEIVGAIESIRDVTETKQAEEELQLAKEKLEKWVGDLERRNREMTLLRQMSDLLQTCDAVSEAFAVIEQYAPKLFPETTGALYCFSKSRRTVESVVTWGENLYSDHVFSPEDCWALRRGQIHSVHCSEPGLRCRHMGPAVSFDYLGVPMTAASEITGLLHLEFQKGAKYDKKAEELALVAAEHLSLSLTNLKLRETLRAQSLRDPLTGLFNRRCMEESLEREIHRAARLHHPVSVVMLDIDHFKRLNDTHGHEAGDAVLMELGAILHRSVREGDIACRFGGEEFLLIMPNASLDVARKRAEYLRETVQSQNFGGNRQPIGTVTISLGAATCPDHGADAEAILRKVDCALYEAKNNGRNRLVIPPVHDAEKRNRIA